MGYYRPVTGGPVAVMDASFPEMDLQNNKYFNEGIAQNKSIQSNTFGQYFGSMLGQGYLVDPTSFQYNSMGGLIGQPRLDRKSTRLTPVTRSSRMPSSA